MMDMERKQRLYYLYKQKEVIINVNYFLRARLKKIGYHWGDIVDVVMNLWVIEITVSVNIWTPNPADYFHVTEYKDESFFQLKQV